VTYRLVHSYILVSGLGAERGEGKDPEFLDDVTYVVHFQIPGLAGGIEINGDFFIFEPGLLKSNVGAVCPWAAAVGIEDDLGGRHGFDQGCIGCKVGTGIGTQRRRGNAIIYGIAESGGGVED
jgi:hypothetical protein